MGGPDRDPGRWAVGDRTPSSSWIDEMVDVTLVEPNPTLDVLDQATPPSP